MADCLDPKQSPLYTKLVERAVDQVAVQLAVVVALVGRLHHPYRHQALPGIDPEVGAAQARPVVVPRAALAGSQAIAQAHGEAQAEAVTGPRTADRAEVVAR